MPRYLCVAVERTTYKMAHPASPTNSLPYNGLCQHRVQLRVVHPADSADTLIRWTRCARHSVVEPDGVLHCYCG